MSPASTYRLLKYFLFTLLLIPVTGATQAQHEVDSSPRDEMLTLAPVTIDGNHLFYVRGVLNYPALRRAKTIENRIYEIAKNYTISPDNVNLVNEEEGRIKIFVGKEYVMSVFDADGEAEGITKEIFAEVIQSSLSDSIRAYRHMRSAPMIKASIIKGFMALGILFIVLITFNFLFKRLNEVFKRKMASRVHQLEKSSFNLIQSNKLFHAFHLFYKIIRTAIIAFICIGFLNYFLGLFPWTKSVSVELLKTILDPLNAFGKGFINHLPNLIVLLLVWFATKYLLRFIRLVFLEISKGSILINGFDADWAMQTFKIVRLFVAVFALVIAFPYIPGSDTAAFQGISVFLGIVFSLGSSSFIANIVAGYSMTYQGAFKQGDFVKVNEYEGFVESHTSMVTRLRSRKNEEIVIPNSIMLGSSLVNYSLRAKKHDLIIHTTVGIGYDTPWRQVDAMLKLAAHRTEGLMKEPEPFVHKKSLGDFAVTYEINAYCLDEIHLPKIYSLLHQNILDVFNENGVAIMTPAYEGDPETPKLVAKDKWDIPLAKNE